MAIRTKHQITEDTWFVTFTCHNCISLTAKQDPLRETLRRRTQQVNKFYLVVFFFILQCHFAKGQSIYPNIALPDSFKKIYLHIDTAKNKYSSPGYYLAVQYNFEDSILVYIGGKLVSRIHLKYILPYKNSEIYPNNRLLIKLNLHRPIEYKYCTIIFLRKKLYLEFKIYKKMTYYSFGMDENSANWNLTLLKNYPWPD